MRIRFGCCQYPEFKSASIIRLCGIFMPRAAWIGIEPIPQYLCATRYSADGVFRIQQNPDSKYVITSLDFMHELLEYTNGEVNSLK